MGKIEMQCAAFGKEITPRLMLTAFTTPLSNMKGAGGDQYIGDCEIPVSLISSLGHDVGNKWFPIYRNDSYEQVAAPEKTGEIRIMYTFSTSKKHMDFGVADKRKKALQRLPPRKKTNKILAAVKGNRAFADIFSSEEKSKMQEEIDKLKLQLAKPSAPSKQYQSKSNLSSNVDSTKLKAESKAKNSGSAEGERSGSESKRES